MCVCVCDCYLNIKNLVKLKLNCCFCARFGVRHFKNRIAVLLIDRHAERRLAQQFNQSAQQLQSLPRAIDWIASVVLSDTATRLCVCQEQTQASE